MPSNGAFGLKSCVFTAELVHYNVLGDGHG